MGKGPDRKPRVRRTKERMKADAEAVAEKVRQEKLKAARYFGLQAAVWTLSSVHGPPPPAAACRPPPPPASAPSPPSRPPNQSPSRPPSARKANGELPPAVRERQVQAQGSDPKNPQYETIADVDTRQCGLHAVPDGFSPVISGHEPPADIGENANCVHNWLILYRSRDSRRDFVWRTARVVRAGRPDAEGTNTELRFGGTGERCRATLLRSNFSDGTGRR